MEIVGSTVTLSASTLALPSRRRGVRKWHCSAYASFMRKSEGRINKYERELEAAVDVVEKACRLCVNVQRQLFSNNKGKGVLEKNDHTPVTIADFGVQALVSMELSRLFPSIPLVAEEDSSQLMFDLDNQVRKVASSSLVEAIMEAVTDTSDIHKDILQTDHILRAIGRGTDPVSSDNHPTAYWVLDPIDGTRGFLRGNDALYVVGLALVEEGKPVLGVMGCPNWDIGVIASHDMVTIPGSITVMAACIGYGTWMKKISLTSKETSLESYQGGWFRCFVDPCGSLQEAHYCIQDRQTWKLLPLSSKLTDSGMFNMHKGNWTPTIIPTCCGSLCKYMMIASGKASVFVLQVAEGATVKAWDHVSGMICVSEAGGEVTSWDGSSLVLGTNINERRTMAPKGGGILVTNGKLHNSLIEII